MREIKIKDATPQNVKPFGCLVSRPKSRPTGKGDLLLYWKQQARFSFVGKDGEVSFLVAKKHPGVYPMLEAHLNTVEILVPLNCAINVAVARPASATAPDMKSVRALRVKQGQAIMLGKGVWHWLPQPVGKSEAEILVIFADNTSAVDMVEKHLDEPFKIVK